MLYIIEKRYICLFFKSALLSILPIEQTKRKIKEKKTCRIECRLRKCRYAGAACFMSDALLCHAAFDKNRSGTQGCFMK